jgi:glycosyltransferase involved in cell wall biosynthesis
MKVLAIHNYYQQRGGEDQCFEDEVNVLKENGHEVLEHSVHNDTIHSTGKIGVAINTLWSRSAYRNVTDAAKAFKPDVVHVMNTFPLLSQSIFYATRKLRIPTIAEVANYRAACAGGVLLRDGKVCELCVGKVLPIAAVKHRCYRGSFSGSAVVATNIALHRMLKTWHRTVDMVMCPSVIASQKLIQAGLPEHKIRVKANALNSDPGLGDGPRGYMVFVGRLSPEKGLHTMVEAWQQDASLPPLKVIGQGPLAEFIAEASKRDPRIEHLGHMPLDELLNVVGRANALIMPSVWYETFGRTTIEAYAKGTPVIGTKIGGTAELIEEGKTGWLFSPGDATELASKVRLSMEASTELLASMRRSTRQKFLSGYTKEQNYERLMQLYEEVGSMMRDYA